MSNNENSTIFSAPAEHNEKPIKKQSIFKKLLASFLCVAIIAGAIVAVISLIPEKEEKKSEVKFEVLNIATDNIEKAEIKSDNKTVTLLSELTEKENSSDIAWSVDGVNKAYTDSSAIEKAVSDAAAITATKEVTGDIKEFGLDNPKAAVTLHSRNKAFDTVTIKIGNTAPAGLGYYCSVSSSDKIYLAEGSLGNLIGLTATDFATTTGLAGVQQTSDNADCFKDGTITDFDYIAISGKNYDTPLKIVPQEDETLNAYFAFKITSPSYRIGDDDTITELLGLLANGITSSGAYEYDPDEKTLKKYRLDNPDIMLSISIKDTAYTILASKVDDNFYAAIDSYGGMIHKIAVSSLTFAEKKAVDYYSSFIVLENLSGLSHFKARFENGEEYTFKTVYESEGEKYSAFYNNTELDIDNFKAFYRQFISLTPVEHETKELKEKTLTVTLVHSNGTRDTVLTFKPYSSGRYQVELDSIPMGLITSTAYDNFAANIKNVANGKPVKE